MRPEGPETITLPVFETTLDALLSGVEVLGIGAVRCRRSSGYRHRERGKNRQEPWSVSLHVVHRLHRVTVRTTWRSG